MLDISLIMLAAGNSSRFNLGVKKQFIRLGGLPLWLYATKNLSSFYPFKKIIVTSSNTSHMQKFIHHNEKYEFVKGGDTRMQSLKNALDLVTSEFVMVSDVARVLVSKELFENLIENINNADCITPALKVADTTLLEDEVVAREKIKLIQTPQLSRVSLLKKALAQNIEFSDDSTAIASVGGKIWFIKGEEKTHKITFDEDLKKLDLPPPSSEIFTGNGFDVHEFGEKRSLILGGVKVHESMGLKAHSDGDVLAHSLTDSLLGAASLGDIGEHFPDTDKAYKNADSMKLLKKAYDLVKEYGFELVNADITIIAQTPRLKDFKDKIACNIASVLNVENFRINIKATTTEKLGFIGRKEGIGVLSSVNLKYFDWMKI
ncbi:MULTISPECIES: bifunctional 2-C-methyl-D-erythritol 4-phosphate cytidylyltransferase/2-C-methyl-D-erythritol 2,4-cyclodiphosphate synthase [unclassified Campylobacter]|uniref:bifunctional 2-C-methyl-D-erythritol 4-phosphate cytidylyltransferase/2-C-methyl-D-erythritol 2,4-cyclodiphosphate synthase n=1 Tax=unclassified Campylobacter TaxID=2593542 RepID=UPI001237D5FB|nr:MULTISPECIES: bifunctional 2-C-methyl-D-erythritol 4-phosphate cytidylyltransferase/2-C-methyl-D-erythritol 2,4-cyclodiphosphate synthase [unclassified Campylobacter]KAA6227244.1 bifunctional 2-C-methyl-D-erythritol 4-phosphate cytidylyltransferase/2-C-methyl-D-erythritol 2,4-cyclodiphosphate synthase [Campylobacter sp. LR286c]KAA6227883.1 bifunctional 2-C-methyl-D-erythritol 4-phosphate cytidylyltransferase/2-C-methyl-D-erythritol 2,4-cyclodiphosphate synthase [Campylobacter sp. LR185c]KAA62